MTLDQVKYYYNKGWEARQIESKVYWNTYAMLMNGEDGVQGMRPKTSIQEIRKYPGYEHAYFNEKGKLIKG